MSLIFKVCHVGDWEKPEHAHAYQGSQKDSEDGFLHFSTAEQLPETLAKYYADAEKVWVIAVATTPLGTALKYEPSRNGEMFPHLYAPLSYENVKWAKIISRDATGRFVVPPDAHG